MHKRDKILIAFVHIEKGAGQTFIRILENNFTYKHCRVAPFSQQHKGIFKANDLKKIFRINPFTQAISGHSIKPYSDLNTYMPNIHYVTIIRDPVERYISHYQYWVKNLNKKIRFEEFLKIDAMRDFQTKKIAGIPQIEEAKRVLLEKFLLVGLLEDFDTFLSLLKIKLLPFKFNCMYEKKNIAKDNSIKIKIKNNMHKFKKEIIRNNKKDIELYHFVKESLLKKELNLAEILNRNTCQDFEHSYRYQTKRELIGKLYRNFYYGPIFTILRYKNGLDIRGSY